MVLGTFYIGLPCWFSSKESTCNAGDTGSVPGSRRCPGRRHGNPLQYSCLENPIDRGAWRATVQGSPSRIQLKRLSTHARPPFISGRRGHASFVKDQVVNISRLCRPHTVSATYSSLILQPLKNVRLLGLPWWSSG